MNTNMLKKRVISPSMMKILMMLAGIHLGLSSHLTISILRSRQFHPCLESHMLATSVYQSLRSNYYQFLELTPLKQDPASPKAKNRANRNESSLLR